MSLLPHSFGTPSAGMSASMSAGMSAGMFFVWLCLHYVSFTERQLILCDDDTGPTDPLYWLWLFKTFKEKIYVYCSSEGTHVILFIFPGFAVKDQPYIWLGQLNKYLSWIWWSWQRSRFKNPIGLKDSMYEYLHWDCSSIYMPGIVLGLYCHQSSLRTVWRLMLLLRY